MAENTLHALLVYCMYSSDNRPQDPPPQAMACFLCFFLLTIDFSLLFLNALLYISPTKYVHIQKSSFRTIDISIPQTRVEAIMRNKTQKNAYTS